VQPNSCVPSAVSGKMQASVARTAAFGRVAPRVVPCPTVQTQEAVRDVCMMAKKKVGQTEVHALRLGGMEALSLWLWQSSGPRANQGASSSMGLVCGAQGVRLIVTVECTEAKKEGATPSRYCTQKASNLFICNSGCQASMLGGTG
jgi:hypothetical protein